MWPVLWSSLVLNCPLQALQALPEAAGHNGETKAPVDHPPFHIVYGSLARPRGAGLWRVELATWCGLQFRFPVLQAPTEAAGDNGQTKAPMDQLFCLPQKSFRGEVQLNVRWAPELYVCTELAT